MQTGLESNLSAFGVAASELAALKTSAELFTDAVLEANILEAAKLAAIQNKQDRKGDAGTRASNLAKRIYANENVTDAMLASLGLAPRPSERKRPTPKVPTEVTATANASGGVTLRWKRNGNSPLTIFVIQQQINGQWTTIRATRRTRETLQGFPPVEAQFRVFAQTNALASPPSLPVIIWGGIGPSPQLSAA